MIQRISNLLIRCSRPALLAGFCICLPPFAFGQEPPVAEKPRSLGQDALLELLRANDKQLDNRKLVVIRRGVDKVLPVPVWKYADLKKYVTDEQGKIRPTPDSISYSYREEFCVRGATISYEKTLLESSAPADSPVTLAQTEKWSNLDGVIKGDLRRDKVFSISRDIGKGPSLTGPLELAERELALGIGYGKRLRQINQFERVADGSYHIRGLVELIPGANYQAELTIGHDLIVRNAVLSISADSHRTEIRFKTTGQAEDTSGILLANSGSFERIAASPVADVAPGSPQAVAPDAFSVEFVSLSGPLTPDEFSTFAKIEPAPGEEIVDPDHLLPKSSAMISPRDHTAILWINIVVVVVVLLFLILRKKTTRNTPAA